jgi:hypothetical protein
MPRKTGARTAQPKSKRVSNDAAPPDTRTCRCCGHTRPAALMVKSKGKPTSICKNCEAARKRAARAANPEAARAKDREKRQRRRRDPRFVERERARGRARARTPRGREINRACVQRYQRKHPERVRAQYQARAAAKRGEIKVAKVCEILGCGCADGLHLHHPRYDRPRDVIATCRHHHEELHHIGPLRLKASAGRRWARAPQHHEGRP